LGWVRFRKPSVLGIATGMVAGLGTITPASGYVGPMGALVIGLVAGVVCFFATQTLKRKLKIDDSLDVFPVHGVGGFTGVLLTAVFSAPALDGLGLPPGVSVGKQLLTQAIGAFATLAWCGVATYVLLKLVNVVLPLRATPEQEAEGLGLVLHEERGYSLWAAGAAARASGSLRVTSSPPPSRFFARTVPPCSSVTRAVIARPMPWPSFAWSRLWSVR